MTDPDKKSVDLSAAEAERIQREVRRELSIQNGDHSLAGPPVGYVAKLDDEREKQQSKSNER